MSAFVEIEFDNSDGRFPTSTFPSRILSRREGGGKDAFRPEGRVCAHLRVFACRQTDVIAEEDHRTQER